MSVPDVLLYTRSTCGHCDRARALLHERSVPFQERSLDDDPELRRRLARRLGRADMPFALVEGELVGGVDALAARLGRAE